MLGGGTTLRCTAPGILDQVNRQPQLIIRESFSLQIYKRPCIEAINGRGAGPGRKEEAPLCYNPRDFLNICQNFG